MVTFKTIVTATLETYKVFSKNDPKELVILIQETIKSFENFQDGLKEAFESKDYHRMKALEHSIASEIFYLKAKGLRETLKALMINPEDATENQEKLSRVIMETDELLQFLKLNYEAIKETEI